MKEIIYGKSNGKSCRHCGNIIPKKVRRYEKHIANGKFGNSIEMVLCPKCALLIAKEFDEHDLIRFELTRKLLEKKKSYNEKTFKNKIKILAEIKQLEQKVEELDLVNEL
jgi:hypothetical protein